MACNARLPDLKNDGHSRCKDCVGHICTKDNKCEECSLWTDDVFASYLKHRHKLSLTRARKAKCRKLNKDKRDSKVSDDSNVKLKQHELSLSVGSSGKSVPSNVIDLDVSRNLVDSFDSSASSLSVNNTTVEPPANPTPFRDQGNTDLSRRVDKLSNKVNFLVDFLVDKVQSNSDSAGLGSKPS